MKVFILKYDHKHGTDLSAYTTEASAEEAAADICVQFADKSIAANVSRLFDEGKFAECRDVYLAEHDNESIEVEVLNVHGAIDHHSMCDHTECATFGCLTEAS